MNAKAKRKSTTRKKADHTREGGAAEVKPVALFVKKGRHSKKDTVLFVKDESAEKQG